MNLTLRRDPIITTLAPLGSDPFTTVPSVLLGIHVTEILGRQVQSGIYRCPGCDRHVESWCNRCEMGRGDWPTEGGDEGRVF